MPGVTAEQVEKAREWDLLSYLKSYEPQELKPSSPNEYRTVTHGSLVIHADKWYWNRGGFGGYTALDYLMKVRQVPFVEAVETLCDGRAAKVHFCGNSDWIRLFCYGRGLSIALAFLVSYRRKNKQK